VAILHICTLPPVLRKLQAEIDSTLSKHPLPEDQIIPDSLAGRAAGNLPYLTACLKEATRLYPPIPATQTRTVPPGGDEWEGVKLPGGTDVGFNNWTVMRDREFWGPDADEFRPERWLPSSKDGGGEYYASGDGVDEKKLREMEMCLDIVFSHGKHRCLGMNIALMELHKAVFEVSCSLFSCLHRTLHDFVCFLFSLLFSGDCPC